MRKNFAQIMHDRKIDLENEYKKLYNLLYEKRYDEIWESHSYYDILSSNFEHFWFRDTCLDLDEFNRQNGFCFEEYPVNFNIDYMISFAEYLYNLAKAHMKTSSRNKRSDAFFILSQIQNLIKLINYKEIELGGFSVFVPINIYSIEVSNINSEYSYETLYYNHHSLKGNIKEKKDLLLKFANYLEPKRKILKTINQQLETDLFHLFNKLDIRHNNRNKEDKAHYVEYLDDLSFEDLEVWYDNVYQMYLLAVLELEHFNKKKELKNFLCNLNS